MDINEFIIGLLFSIYFILIFTFIPSMKINEIELIFIRQASFEEIFFRFFMIGSNKKYFRFDSLKEALSTLIISNIVFTMGHDYDLWGNLQIFSLGLVWSYIFLSINIIPTIIAHALWNLYLDYNFKSVLILPIIIATIKPAQAKINSLRATTDLKHPT